MSKLTELEQQLKATQEQTSKLQKEIEKEKGKTFEPFRGSYVVDMNGGIHSGYNGDSDAILKQYQYWQTRDQAERYLKARTMHAKLFQMAEHFNGGWEPDWRDRSQIKFCIYYAHMRGCYAYTERWRDNITTPPFKDSSTVKKVVEILNNESI